MVEGFDKYGREEERVGKLGWLSELLFCDTREMN
jgi:hypothetical protein